MCRSAHFERNITRSRTRNKHYFEVGLSMKLSFPKTTWPRALHGTIACWNIICPKPATLTHFWLIVPLYTSWNTRKPRSFLVIFRGYEMGNLIRNELKIAYVTLGSLGNVLEQLLQSTCEQLFLAYFSYWYLPNFKPIIHFSPPESIINFQGA